MTPTDEQINALAAKAVGWQEIEETFFATGKGLIGFRPLTTNEGKWEIPDYCQDRNALPELFAAVEQKFSIWKFAAELPVYDISDDPCLIAYRALTLSAREVTIAALKALDAWPSDWSETP